MAASGSWALRETKGALDATGAVYAPTLLLPAGAAAAPRATDWDVQLKSDPAFGATRIRAILSLSLLTRLPLLFINVAPSLYKRDVDRL